MTNIVAEVALAIGGSSALSIIVKATVLVSIALGGARLAGGARASVRYLFLAAAFGVLLVLPIAALLMPSVAVDILIAQQATNPIAVQQAGPDNGAEYSSGKSAVPRSDAVRREWPWVSASTLFGAGWALGAALFLAPLANGLWRLRRVCRGGLPWPHGQAMAQWLAVEAGVRRRVDVLIHEETLGPMTCGLVRPVVVLPPDARAWCDSDLRQALVHEIEHVRRGDWLIHFVARFVCALYWFRPLVWRAWRRLGLEAERACDDAVLRGAERTAYAEQLVMLAQRLLTSTARPVLSMANRSDLSARVFAVLDRDQPRGRAGISHVVVIAIAAIVLVLGVSPLRAVAPRSAQTTATGPKPLTFEVASVRPNRSGPSERGLAFQPSGRFMARNVPLRSLIATAYGDPRPLPLYRILGGPSWIDSDGFDIEAKAADNFAEREGAPAFSTSGRLMLRSLLAERFKLIVHEETRQLPLYRLVLARRDGRTGAQLRLSSGADCVEAPPPGEPPRPSSNPNLPPCGVARLSGRGHLSGYYATPDQIAKILELATDRVVSNGTGLSGHFSFALDFTPGFLPATAPNAAVADDRPADDRTSLFTAVQEQLGLKLESQRGPVAVLVIGSAAQPTPD
jgi:bla regulator protein BlaR1